MTHTAWAYYGRMGRRRTGPVGRRGLLALAQADRPVDVDDFLGPNERRAHCKICGAILWKGQGHGFIIWSANGYNLSTYYACDKDYDWLKRGMPKSEANSPLYPSPCCNKETRWERASGSRQYRRCPCGGSHWF